VVKLGFEIVERFLPTVIICWLVYFAEKSVIDVLSHVMWMLMLFSLKKKLCWLGITLQLVVS